MPKSSLSFRIILFLSILFIGTFIFFGKPSFVFASSFLSLKSGWNLISPGNLEVELSRLIKDNPQCGIFNKVYWFNGKRYENPSRLEPMKGYWLFSQKDCKAILSGKPGKNTLSLHHGWNQISPLENKSFNELNKDNSCKSYFRWVFGWNPQKKKYEFIRLDQKLDPKKGYWVWVYAGCEIGEVKSVKNIIIRDAETHTQIYIIKGNDLEVEIKSSLPPNFIPQKANVYIYNLEGRKVREFEISWREGFQGTTNTSELALGVYLLTGEICSTNKCESLPVRKFIIASSPPPVPPYASIKVEKVSGTTFKAILDEGPDYMISDCKIIWGDGESQRGIKPHPGIHTLSHTYASLDYYEIEYWCFGKDPELLLADGDFIYIRKKPHVKDEFFDILFIPIGFSSAESDKFEGFVQRVYENFLKKTPFREISGPEKIVKKLLLPLDNDCSRLPFPSNIQNTTRALFKCAENSIYAGKYDLVVGLINPNYLPKVKYGWGVANIGGVISYSFFKPNKAGVPPEDIVLHEMGHNFGLYHLKGCGATWNCQGPNRADCFQPENIRKTFIMDYCYPAERFGPAAYNYLKNVVFKEYLK